MLCSESDELLTLLVKGGLGFGMGESTMGGFLHLLTLHGDRDGITIFTYLRFLGGVDIGIFVISGLIVKVLSVKGSKGLEANSFSLGFNLCWEW